jgi:hypothetical protein
MKEGSSMAKKGCLEVAGGLLNKSRDPRLLEDA